MPEFTLIIGNKNYSSWSLRAWLWMKHLNIDFEEIVIANIKLQQMASNSIEDWKALLIDDVQIHTYPENNKREDIRDAPPKHVFANSPIEIKKTPRVNSTPTYRLSGLTS